MNKEKQLDEKIEELKKEIKEIPEGYTGNVNYLKEHILKAKLSAYEDAQKIFREAVLNVLKNKFVKFSFDSEDYRNGFLDGVKHMKDKIKQEFGKLSEEKTKEGIIANE